MGGKTPTVSRATRTQMAQERSLVRITTQYKAPVDDAQDGARPPRYELDVQGQSMHPTLQDGDRITIEPVPPEALRRGDVVYCHDGQQGVVHRLHAARRAADGWLLQTRGDCRQRPDPPWMVERLPLFGRVTAARRTGRAVPVDAWWQRWWFTAPALPVWLRFKEQGLRPLLYALQGSPLYARIARRWHARLVATVQEHARQHPDCWTVRLQYGRRIIAGANYYPKSQALASLWVNWPYRRLGLARRLVEAVLRHVQEEDAPRVQLSLRTWNWPARRLYEQMGFTVTEPTSLADDPGLLLERRL